MLEHSGLGKPYWREVIDVLKNIIPVYDKVNSVISLGKDNDFRKEGIIKSIMPGNVILDAGSGYGNMSKTVMENVSTDITVFFYDPIYEMLNKVKDKISMGDKPFSFFLYNGVFESIPFKSNNFDAILCVYSLLDVMDFHISI